MTDLRSAVPDVDLTAALVAAEPLTPQSVHKTNPEHVMLRALALTEPGTVVMSIDWTSTFGQVDQYPWTPHLRLVEVARQASLAAAHHVRGVPRDYFLIAAKAHAQFHPDAALLLSAASTGADDVAQAQAQAQVQALALVHRFDAVDGGVSHETEVWDGSVLLAHISGVSRDFSPAAYQPVRAGVRRRAEAARTAAPALEAGEDLVVVDLAHPDFFDHESDHVPGMMLLDAAMRRAYTIAARDTPVLGVSAALAAPRIVSLSAVFTVFAELDAPVTVSTVVPAVHLMPASDHSQLDVTFTQDGSPVAAGDIQFKRPLSIDDWAQAWPS